MAMYHSWGSQNAWLRQIYDRNFLYVAQETARGLGLEDGDWVSVTSRSGSVSCPIRLMEGVNSLTVWTWNAIGKRAGAWMLSTDAPESRQGFLLNHVIATFLPERDGRRLPSSDPVTGQAAWYDVRVRIEKAAKGVAETTPRQAAVLPPPGMPPGMSVPARRTRA
jgi:anaerobic selenocysteine-containing dehydrogenase